MTQRKSVCSKPYTRECSSSSSSSSSAPLAPSLPELLCLTAPGTDRFLRVASVVEMVGPSSELSPSEGEEAGSEEGGEGESAPPKREKSAKNSLSSLNEEEDVGSKR